MTNDEPKPVHISVDGDGKVSATLDGEPVDVADLLAMIQAAASDAPDG
jgi:hypothetical protein